MQVILDPAWEDTGKKFECLFNNIFTNISLLKIANVEIPLFHVDHFP